MEWTKEQYNKCLKAATKMQMAIDSLQTVPKLEDGAWMVLFAKRLHEVYEARDKYVEAVHECFLECIAESEEDKL